MAASGVQVALPILVGAALLFIAAVVARQGWRHRHNRFFALLYTLSGLKSIGEGLLPVADRFHADAPLFPDAAAWTTAGVVCGLAMTPVLFLFVASFPRPTEWMARRPALGLVAFVPSIAIGYVLFTSADPAVAFRAGVSFAVFATVVTASALWWLWKAHTSSKDAIERTQIAYVSLGFLPAFLVTWVLTALYVLLEVGAARGRPVVDLATAQVSLTFIVTVLSPVIELLAAGLLAIAILRYNAFGVTTTFKVGVRSGGVAVLFLAIFLLTQFVENVILQGKVFAFAGPYGSFVLAGATGLILFKPMERLSQRLTSRIDHGSGPAQLTHPEQVYHAQCRYVLRDVFSTDREIAVLWKLRGTLGISEERAIQIEEQVEAQLGIDNPRMGRQGSKGASPSPV